MVRPSFYHALFDAANILSFLQSLHPRSILWILLIQTTRPAELRQQALSNQVPSDEGQVGESALVANQPASAVCLQTEFEHTDYAVNFVRVAFDGRRKLLGMEACEPSRLAVVRPLTYVE